ncbi:MAG: cofactor-independent phosphoglycerate mutase [Candidatus Aegiribacteria sp.]|nr:cofactor-independent phosphoglycerate mutase [Candidatus Aegiribacteria sp.]
MKYIIILGDGMSDRPIESLGGKTPLMVADIPNIDSLCARGRCGKFVTVPPGMPPGSAVANLAVLGYDPAEVFQGRGVLEAASMGVELEYSDLAMRCNLICIENGKIKNHSAGHISTEESHQLIETLNEQLGSDTMVFYPGVSYRHLFVLKDGSDGISCTPPHDVPGTDFDEVMISVSEPEGNKTAALLNILILKSQEILKDHPINLKRISEGKDPANSVWFWSPGHKPEMKTLTELYGIKGAVISAVDLVKGLGIYAGMDVIEVEGATGLYDTNYEGKAQAAIDALKGDYDFVYLHVEATDEAGHEGDVDLKIRTIEYLDRRVVRFIVEETEKMKEDVAIAITPDHGTPCDVRTHVHDPVPFLIYRPGENPDDVMRYDETSAESGSFGTIEGNTFIRALFKR